MAGSWIFSVHLVWTYPEGGEGQLFFSLETVSSDRFKNFNDAFISFQSHLQFSIKTGMISPLRGIEGSAKLPDYYDSSYIIFFPPFLSGGFGLWNTSRWFAVRPPASLRAATVCTVVSLWCQQMEKANVFTVWMGGRAGSIVGVDCRAVGLCCDRSPPRRCSSPRKRLIVQFV